MPSSKRSRERQLAKLAVRRAAERRRKRRQRIVAGVVGGAVFLGAIAAVALALTGGGEPKPAASGSPSPSASASASPSVSGSPGSNCGYVQTDEPTGDRGSQPIPEFAIDTTKGYKATIKTSLGTIRAKLFPAEAPCAVNSFVALARAKFYDGLTFHRVVQDFVIQGGDPTGTGSGGPGYSFNDELDNDLSYKPGTVAMANSGPNTNGSQWFIVASDAGATRLTKSYTIFGEVSDGMDVVTEINKVPTKGGEGADADMPVDPVTIISVRIKEIKGQA